MSAPQHLREVTDEKRKLANAMSLEGLTYRQIARVVCVTYQRVQRWLHNQELKTSHRNYMRRWAAGRRA